MPVPELRASPILLFERFSSFEEYRPNDLIGGGTSFPLNLDEFSASRAALALPSLRLAMQRTFARRLEGDLGAPGAALVVPMADDSYAELNGRRITDSTVTLLRGEVPARTLEPHPNTFVMLRFHSDMQNRGWADFQQGLELYQASADRMHRLRSELLEILQLASACSDVRQFFRLADAMQDSLLAALDDVLVSRHAVRPSQSSSTKHQRLLARLDELARESPTIQLYSDDLARKLDVSVRTLQTAVKAVHGVSLHQYLKLRRLWSAHCRLSAGPTGLSVKAAALANGFWHMGDFSRDYRATFGELPSETLARRRRL